MFKVAPYRFSSVPWVGQLLKNTRVTKLGFVFKMSRDGDLSYYLTTRGNIRVYDGIRCKSLSILFTYVQYYDLKEKLKRAPSPLLPVVFVHSVERRPQN
jgi:hypothetical protein